MSVKGRKGGLYLYFRPFKNKQIGLKLDVTTKTEAKQLEAILTRACRTGNYAGLVPIAQDICIRMFHNQGWEIPVELGGGTRQNPPQKALTLLDACRLFMQYPEIKVKKKRAVAGYENALANIGEILGSDTPLKDLWVPDLKAYQIKRLSKGAAPSTINIELSALSRVFAVMIEMQLIETNPVRLVKRLSTKSNEREVYLSRETVQVIADECPAWFRSIVWTAYFSGMRKGEIVTLTRRQMDLKKRMIHLFPEDTKESRRKRVPIHHELVPILAEAVRTPFFASDKVFLVQDGRGIRSPGTDSIDNPWPRACEALKAKKLMKEPFPRFHDLRHTWKTNARRSRMDPEIREAILGHAERGKSVTERYGRISDQELIHAIDKMTFDHGETEIFVTQREKPAPEKNVNICEHGGVKKRKKIQAVS
jgi:integrase